MVRPERFELPAFWFVARRSIQLSYGRNTRAAKRLIRQEIRHECRCRERVAGAQFNTSAGFGYPGTRYAPACMVLVHPDVPDPACNTDEPV